MSPQGRPKGEYRIAQHEGTPVGLSSKHKLHLSRQAQSVFAR